MNDLPTTGDPRLELLRAMRSCHPEGLASHRLTFAGGVSTERWLTDIFRPILKPQLEAAWSAWARRDAKGWQAADRAIEEALPLNMAARSREAGGLLAANYTAPAGEKLWTRMVKEIAEGRQPGHLASVMALRGATFSLSPRVTLGCYLLAEARGGWGSEAESQWFDLVDDAMSVPSAAAAAFRVA